MSYTASKSTKSCELRLHLKSGEVIVGRLHVDGTTSSSIRPSDALRISPDYILLTDAKMETGEGEMQSHIMIRGDAVSYVELPRGWS